MASGTILVVDDEPGMLRLVSLYLRQAGFGVETEESGAAAVDRAERGDVDLVVLDLGLPDIDGYRVCQEIRSSRDVPIVMLTARSEPRDRIQGFRLGADDYVCKPFIPDELVARVGAVLRRSRPEATSERQLTLNGIIVNPVNRTVTVEGRGIELRPKEFDLLVALASQPNKVFTRHQLLWRVWGYDSLGDTATVDVHVGRLRRKLGDSGRESPWIRTVWGVGYCFDAQRRGT